LQIMMQASLKKTLPWKVVVHCLCFD